MFGTLTEKFRGIFSKLSSEKKLTEVNVAEAVNEVRLALLEADVQYGVVKNFIKRVKERAVGENLMQSVTPGQQFVKIVHDELVNLMGAEEAELTFRGRPASKPAKLLLCGLQGSGKTTQAAKIAHFLKKQGRFARPCLVACDLQRPAAIEQLRALATMINVDFVTVAGSQDPLQVAESALRECGSKNWDLIIFDTAGRLHVDEALMNELENLRKLINPEEIVFVANAATGQDVVKSALQFHNRIGITGTILTMLDGTSRAGAALSLRDAIGAPILFEGIGERVDDLRSFHPQSMADRILGMGDTINLVRKAQEHFEEKEAEALEKKIRKAELTYEDYLKQLKTLRKMGSLKSILSMLPGFSQLKDIDFDEALIFKIEAILHSMTPDELQEKCELSNSRRRRIAKGSGVKIDDVHRLVKTFKQTKIIFKKKLGGSLWR
jgi:signal recognition particle subunit SRP54